MASNRLVECQDCGYRWESSADNPRCSQSDCGRSRNVEDVADDLDDDLDDEADDQLDQQPVEDDTDDDLDDGDDDGGRDAYTPAFESENVRTDTDPGSPSSSTSTSTSTDDEDDEDDEASDGPSGPDEVPELDPEQLVPAFEASFNMVAVQRGQHWELSDDEAEQLAEGWTPVINHYAPYVMRQYTELGLAAMVTFSVVGPRLAKDKQLSQRAEKAAEDTDDSGTVRESTTVEDAVEDEQDGQTAAGSDSGPIGGFANV